MVGVGIHAHHLLAQLLGRIREVDAVAQRLGHLGLAVGARKPHADGIFGEQNLRLDERRTVDRIELVDDFARLLNHRLLVLSGRHGGGAEGRDVRGLADGVGEEAHGNALALRTLLLGVGIREAAELDFGLHRRVALQTGHGDQVHVVEGQLAQLGNLRLDEDGGALGVEAAREVVERHLDDVLAHLFRVVGVVGERLRVGNHDEDALVFARILQLDAAAQRAYVVSQVKFSGGAVPREYDFSHICCFPAGVVFRSSLLEGLLRSVLPRVRTRRTPHVPRHPHPRAAHGEAVRVICAAFPSAGTAAFTGKNTKIPMRGAKICGI